MAAVTDEIFEKYLQKAIAETNELGDEIARAAGEGQVPVLGSGHPLADVFLLKHSPQPAEVREMRKDGRWTVDERSTARTASS